MKFTYFFAALALLLTPLALRATPTENHKFRVLPAAGKVAVDGKVDDWDLSAGIFACDDVEEQREHFGVWLHAQYDAENLYVLARWIDETPLNNPGQSIADYGFAGDSLQFRTLTAAGTPQERGQHFTAWRGHDGADVIKVEQGKDFKEGAVVDAKKTHGAQQVFAVNPDGKGYVQELAIPWKLLTRDGLPIKAGGSFTLTFEANFTLGGKGRGSTKDLFKPGISLDRVFTFMNIPCWGTATLAAAGKVTPQPVRLADAREFAVRLEKGVPAVDWTGLIKSKEMPGFIPIAFTLAEDGYISLNIKNSAGVVVRQLLTTAFFTKGRHEVKWDGLSTWSWKHPGEPVPAGDYSWSALTHPGLGLKLRGWAANGGVVPWDSADGRGNWGGDHGIPSAVATDEKQVYLGWTGAEAGKSVLACDLDGRVLWSNNRGGIAGVKALASDGRVLYVLGGNAGTDAEGGNLYKLDAKDGSYLKWDGSDIVDLKIKSLWPADAQAKPERADGISVKDGQIQLAFPQNQFAAILNAADGKFVRIEPTADFLRPPRAVAKDGTLFTWKGEPDNQVVVSKDGKVVQTIGRKGGRALLGAWQPDGLRFVQSMAVDAAGKLWIAEGDAAPKRMSAWDLASGKLVHEFFGPTTYGALGGAICPTDPNVMVGQGCEWRLDPQTGRARLTAVITRGGMENSRFATGTNGKTYLAVAASWIGEPKPVKIFERLGDADYKLRCVFRYEGKDAAAKTVLWTDANGDEQEQPEEITSANGRVHFSAWYMNLAPDLTIYAGDRQFKVAGFTTCGAPRYDLSKPVKLPIAGLGSADGRLILKGGDYGKEATLFTCADLATGQTRWTYPDTFNGVHGSHNAPPPAVGLIRGSYGIMATAKLPAPVGNVWAIGSNVGEWHLLNEDGFYLGKLFEGDPMKVKWPDQATPGADMTRTPPGMGGEDFGGNIALGKDGKLAVQAGKTAFWNLEVTGLDRVQALVGASVKVSDADTAKARGFREQQLQAAVGARRLTAKKLTPKFSGDLEQDFKGAEIVKFQKQDDAAVRAALAWDDQNLYLAWDVRDATPWINGAAAPEQMYLSGDTVDFQLGTDAKADPKRDKAAAGDFRLSIGNFKGQPTAVLYREVSAQKQPKIFSSGVIKSFNVDSVATVPTARIEVKKQGDRYLIEAAIPLTALALQPTAGLTLRGDFGVTHGDPAGKRTRLRTYWSNQHTGIVDDAVFELMLEPKNWGEVTF